MNEDELRLDGALNEIAEFEEIYRSAPVGLSFVDADLRCRRINERLAAINGRSVEAHLGRTIEEIIPELAEQVTPYYRKVLETGQPIERAEVTGGLPADPDVQGSWLMSLHPLKSADGAVAGITCVVQDVSALKQREEELRVVRARLAEAEHQAQLGCWEWDLLTGVMWWSDEIYRIFGQDPRTFTPEFDVFIEQIVEEDRAAVRAQLDGVYAGSDSVDAEFRLIALDGTEHAMHSRARLTRTEDGEPQILFGTAQDVTEDRCAREAFERERAVLQAEKADLERLLDERTGELDRALDRLRRPKR